MMTYAGAARSFVWAAGMVTAGGSALHARAEVSFRLSAEVSLGRFGGIPFCVDLDGDGRVEVLWLQSPGLFHSKVFDAGPWKGRFTADERAHFCLTATDRTGAVRWQVGRPWAGKRPFVTHCAERALDAGDIDGDGVMEVVCVRRDEILVIDARTGEIENAVKAEADNVQIIRLGKTGPKPTDWTILAKNSESAYPPHEYANPAWFYDRSLKLLKRADYLGAGHAPQALDIDDDGRDEFLIGYNLIDDDLRTAWTFSPVEKAAWNAAEMHVDDIAVGQVGGQLCVALAASDTAYLLEAATGKLIWQRKGVHPQHCRIGRFRAGQGDNQVFVHNKRADLQLYDAAGTELWRMTPPANFPLGRAAPCKRQKFHMFDPTTVLAGAGEDATDLLIFTDGGWPYVIDGAGRRSVEIPLSPNAAQDWGEVPGRPDDYGYGYYARVADFDGDDAPEVLINDRRYAWFYEIEPVVVNGPPRSNGRVLHVDFENYVDGVVQALNAGVRWLGDPFSGRPEGNVEVTKEFAFSGTRSGRVLSTEAEKIARIRLQRRFDAKPTQGDGVIEFVYRPGRDKPIDLKDLTVWEARSSTGKPVGLTLLANGEAKAGTYRIDVIAGGKGGAKDPARIDGVVDGLKQTDWIRVVQHRRRDAGVVDLWVGRPGQEKKVGTYADRFAGGDVFSVELGDTSTGGFRGGGLWDDIRIGGRLAPGQGVAPGEPPLRDVSRQRPTVPVPIVVDRARQLFVDDRVIESSSGLTRTLHPVRKHDGNPLIVPEHPWEGRCVLLYGGVIRDPETGLFRMWYLTWGKQIGQPSFVCYAESKDGLRWTKPQIGRIAFNDSKKNNIVMNGWSQTTVHYDANDPDPSRRYKALLRLDGTRAFFSADGFDWRDMGVVLEQAYDGTTAHWDPIGRKWIAMVKIFRDGRRARGYAESEDFLNWTDTYHMATVDERDKPGDQMYAMYMFHYESAYFGLLRMYNTDSETVDIQLATSRNAKHWDRSIRTPFIPTASAEGAWDYANNAVPSTPPIRVGDELWFYYSGRSTPHNVSPNDGAIGLGTLRVDGFVSMDGGPRGGTLTTCPLRLKGGALYVNVDAAEGEVRAEILGADGEAIEPFSLTNCEPIRKDTVRHQVRWKDADGVKSLKGRDVRLRLHVTNAKVYSFWVE